MRSRGTRTLVRAVLYPPHNPPPPAWPFLPSFIGGRAVGDAGSLPRVALAIPLALPVGSSTRAPSLTPAPPFCAGGESSRITTRRQAAGVPSE